FAARTVGRWNQKSAPWYSLEPPFVMRETCAPDERPNWAFGFAVTTRNSSIASAFKRSTVLVDGLRLDASLLLVLPIWFDCCSLMSTPSSVTFAWSAREPVTASSLVTPG